jgi:hypothetical protein
MATYIDVLDDYSEALQRAQSNWVPLDALRIEQLDPQIDWLAAR